MDQTPPTDLVRSFLDASHSEKNLSPRTLKAYRGDLAQFVSFLGRRSILETALAEIRIYLAWLEKKGLRDTSIKRKLACLKVFYAFLCSEGLVADSPLKNLGCRFKTKISLPRAMSLDEVTGLLRAAYVQARGAEGRNPFTRFRALRDRAILELLFSTGMRVDEVTLLDMEDLDLAEGQVRIMGKGRKERIVYLTSSEVSECLRRYVSVRNTLGTITDAVFLNRSLDRLGTGSIRTAFKKYASRAGITAHYTPHCLRHTMATMLVENGADVRSIQEILGHSRISTTEIYLHVSSSRKRAVLEQFNGRNRIRLTRR